MESKINALVIKPADNVAVAVEALNEGELAIYMVNGEKRQTRIIQNIPVYHKFSLADIKEGESVLKYGENIGTASTNICAGEHVHTHNVTSNREQIPR